MWMSHQSIRPEACVLVQYSRCLLYSMGERIACSFATGCLYGFTVLSVLYRVT